MLQTRYYAPVPVQQKLLPAVNSLLSLSYGVYLSFKAAGEGGLRVGSLGILSLILAVIGTVIGLISFKEDNKFYGTSRFGSMLCGVIAVFMIAVFLMGI